MPTASNPSSSVRTAWAPRFALIVSLWAPAPLGLAQTAPTSLDTYESRLEMLALTQTLNAEILASSSATQSLEKWCRDHKMADDPIIVARVIAGIHKVPTVEQLQRLQVTSVSDVNYRRVELRCGSHVFSEADNWYVPSRLTAEMNKLLETGETPFGKAVLPLRPYRRTFAVTLLWSPLPAGWEQQRRPRGQPGERGRALVLPKDLFEHRAILYTSDHQPFSEVNERYQEQLLAFLQGR
jgi:chorismate-pyruvate lyase